MVIRNTIRERREKLGMSCRQLAKIVSMDFGMLSRIERGEGTVNDARKVELARALGTTVSELFFPDVDRELAGVH